MSNATIGVYDTGATCDGQSEADIVRDVADGVLASCNTISPAVLVAPECSVKCLNAHAKKASGVPVSHLSYTIEWLNRITKPFDFILALHMNASDGPASGVEVYYSDGATSIRRRQAQAAAKAIAAVLEIPNRDAKPSGSSQHSSLGILDRTKAPALLIELGFITNATDRARVQERGVAAVKAAIEALRTLP